LQDVLLRLGINTDISFKLIFFSLIWVRVVMMASVVPFLFGKPVPKRVVVAASFVLAAFAYFQLVPEKSLPIPQHFLTLMMLYIKEIFFGLSIGLTAGIFFYAFTAVGQMIDNQRGVSIARVLIPQLGSQAAISGMILFQLGVVLYLAMGGHLVFLKAFFESFADLPVMSFPSTGPGMFALVDMFMRLTGKVIYISIQMSTPILITIFLTDIILGIANRIAPQINVWMLGFTTKGYVGTLMLFIAITMIGDQMIHYGRESNQNVATAIRYLKGDVGKEEISVPENANEGIKKPGPIHVETR